MRLLLYYTGRAVTVRHDKRTQISSCVTLSRLYSLTITGLKECTHDGPPRFKRDQWLGTLPASAGADPTTTKSTKRTGGVIKVNTISYFAILLLVNKIQGRLRFGGLILRQFISGGGVERNQFPSLFSERWCFGELRRFDAFTNSRLNGFGGLNFEAVDGRCFVRAFCK